METSSCGSGCGCGGVSRREVLAAGVAAAVVGTVIGSGTARAAGAIAVDEGTWTATALKAADLVDKEAKGVDGQPVMLSREGKKVFALSTKCTHKGCTLKPKAGVDTVTCQCHKAGFDLEGNVTHAPAKLPLPRYALRMNKDGVVEVDMSKTVDHDAADGVLTLS